MSFPVAAGRPQLSIKVGKLFELVAVIKKDIDNEDLAEGKSSGIRQVVQEVEFTQVFACYWYWPLTGLDINQEYRHINLE